MNSQIIERIKHECSEVTEKSIQSLSGLKGRHLLITGGTGFIGTWLAELLTFLNDTHKFNIHLTLLSPNALDFSAKAPHLAMRKDITLVAKDVRNILEMPQETSYVIHAAATPDSRQHSSDPLKTMEVISRGTEATLAAASRLSDLKKIVNVSSGLIYGSQPIDLERLPEDFHGGPDCDSITAEYPEAKRYAETICAAYRNQYKLPIVTVRPFAFIGPYQLLDKPWAINNFIRDSILGGPVRILGDERTVRSYMYASDMAFWMLRILVDGKNGLAYNLGSPCGITLRQLAQKITSNFPIPPEIESGSETNDKAKISKFVPDISRAEETLKLCLSVDIDEAIRRTITWHKANVQAGS